MVRRCHSPRARKTCRYTCHCDYKYPSGETVRISEAAKSYQVRMQAAAESESEDVRFITNKLSAYEEKYGPIEHFKHKSDTGELVTSDEDIDLDVWIYLLKRKEELLC